jgi:hypothetical protein
VSSEETSTRAGGNHTLPKAAALHLPGGLWEHQRRAVETVHAYLGSSNRGDRAALVTMPTGTGKTGVIAATVTLLPSMAGHRETPRVSCSAPYLGPVRVGSSFLVRHSASHSAGGTSPISRWRRTSLYQPIHSTVASSSAIRLVQRRRLTSSHL